MPQRQSLGIYLSVPFCKAKCSFCNFASDAFAPGRMDGYVSRLCEEMREANKRAKGLGAQLGRHADSIYFGGGTPSLLSDIQFGQIFRTLREEFEIAIDAEITIECAPGQLEGKTLDELLKQGMNRVSLGVQSFVDRESAAVGRFHTGDECDAEIVRLRAAGVERIGLDLISGLPRQTESSWRASLDRTINSGATHVSVYMLEIDEDSRLGREVLAGGTRYGAGAIPSEDEAAAWYEIACEVLGKAGIAQYEISNFAREGYESKHNLKYWRRLPYIGYGLDAHSMLPSATDDDEVLRFQNTDALDMYMKSHTKDELNILAHAEMEAVNRVGREEAFEESLFLGLRLNEGVDLSELRRQFGADLVASVMPPMFEAEQASLIEMIDERIRLTVRGRMASNEVFSRLLVSATV
ncbi:MAG: radical SAM family heme chaperone HemW [Acidobacteria bacterium]|nr:radical SAM family heme chaperone HemW [Acidobacteriota bacterium]